MIFHITMNEPTTTAINVAVLDDDANVRNGLWWLLNHVVGLRCTGTYASCAEFLAKRDPPPDVLLLDVSMPIMSGLDGIRPIKAKYPTLKILMHSHFDDEDKIARARQAGALGYVLKNALAPQLYDAILAVHRGGAVWPASFDSEAANPARSTFLKILIRKIRAAGPKIKKGITRIRPRQIRF